MPASPRFLRARQGALLNKGIRRRAIAPDPVREGCRDRTEEDRKRDRFRDENISNPARDLYVPLALLVIGFFATIG